MDISELLVGQQVKPSRTEQLGFSEVMTVVGFSDNGVEPVPILRDDRTGEDYLVHPANICTIVGDRQQHHVYERQLLA